MCVVAGITVDAGAFEPLNLCAQCVPGSASTQFSPRADGLACGLRRVCAAGSCASACFIDGVIRPAMAVNPDNACERCEPGTSTTSWSSQPDGTTCAGDEVCSGRNCQAKCFIDGALVAANQVNPADPCQQCNPSISTSAWSTLADGSTCGAGTICSGGACAERCFIGGFFYAMGASNAGNPCELCQPSQSTNAFTVTPDGTACGTGLVCASGTCTATCVIGGLLSADGAINPLNGCQQCAASNSTTSWSPRAAGTSCGSGQICEASSCVSKCLIGGMLYAADAVNPLQACEQCKPATSTTSWTLRASVPLLVGGQPLAAQGWVVVSQAPFTLTTGADFTRLATSTNGGAPSSGQLLISRAGVVDAGVPFTLRAELQVESASPHNPLDSGAAILATFTPPLGMGTDRATMVYLDPTAIGWADDTQSAAIAITNGLYRTYLFSVDATNTARVSVDGVPLLTRSGFVSNGTFAFGDQSNDPNVDGVMRIRSVDLMCP